MKSDIKFRIEIYNDHSEIYKKVLDLHIRNVEKEDYGNYTCIAYNKLGKDKETMLLYGMCIYINVIGVRGLTEFIPKTSF